MNFSLLNERSPSTPSTLVVLYRDLEMYPQLSYSSVACKGNVLSLPYHLHLRKK